MNEPRLLTQHPDAIPTLGARWGVLGCLAWIVSRDARLLAAVEAEEARWAGGGWAGLPAVAASDLVEDLKLDFQQYCDQDQAGLCFSWACEQLAARASTGDLNAAGFRDGSSAPEKIEGWEFNSPGAFVGNDGFRLLSHVGRLQFGGPEVVEAWPGDVDRLKGILTDSIAAKACSTGDPVLIRTAVDVDAFREWVSDRIEEGLDQTAIVSGASAAFPKNIVPGREDRREIHRVEHRRLKGIDPKPGKEVK